MKFYDKTHKYTCGIDLHGKNLHMCIWDETGKKRVHRRVPNDGEKFLKIIAPYREDLVVGVESTFNWYWLGDLCMAEKVPFVLGHALYMKAIHQGKTKNDAVDSDKVTRLTAGKLLPTGYAYPREKRMVRDLMRRRLYFVRERAALKGHVKIVSAQYNVSPLMGENQAKAKTRDEILSRFPHEDIRESIDCNLQSIVYLNSVVRRLEKHVLKRVKKQNSEAFELLHTVIGIGDVLGLTILYEMESVERFPRVQDFLSYARLVRSIHTSDGTKVGKGSRKIGNPYLKWAFSEAAVQMAKNSPEVGALVEALKKRYGPAGAWSRLSMKIARCVYFMLKNKESFDLERFIKNSKGALESRCSLELPSEVAMVID